MFDKLKKLFKYLIITCTFTSSCCNAPIDDIIEPKQHHHHHHRSDHNNC